MNPEQQRMATGSRMLRQKRCQQTFHVDVGRVHFVDHQQVLGRQQRALRRRLGGHRCTRGLIGGERATALLVLACALGVSLVQAL